MAKKGYDSGGSGGRFNPADLLNKTFKLTFKSALLIAAVIVIALLAKSSFYKVDADENAVIKRFGKVVAVQEAGPHFKLPYPIETVTKAMVKSIHRMEIGYREKGGRSQSFQDESHMLTGDENIISIDFIVQYQVRDIEQYLFNLQDVQATIRLAAEASIREVAGKALIDDLLTTGKEEVQDETRSLIQEILDGYDSGVRIVAVELQDIEPPAAVMGAFQDVASAREDKNKYINEAQAYENQMKPAARAQAETMVLEAQSYSATLLGKAEGEAERFRQVYESYRKSPDNTRRRMYLEAVMAMMEKSEVLVVDESVNNLNLFSGSEMFQGTAGGAK